MNPSFQRKFLFIIKTNPNVMSFYLVLISSSVVVTCNTDALVTSSRRLFRSESELPEKILVHNKNKPECNELLFGLDFFLGRRDLQHRRLGHFQQEIIRRNAQMNAIVLERHDRSPQAAAGGDLVAGLEPVQHGLPLFLTALLGQNQEKIKNGENEDKGCHTEPPHAAATTELYCQ